RRASRLLRRDVPHASARHTGNQPAPSRLLGRRHPNEDIARNLAEDPALELERIASWMHSLPFGRGEVGVARPRRVLKKEVALGPEPHIAAPKERDAEEGHDRAAGQSRATS